MTARQTRAQLFRLSRAALGHDSAPEISTTALPSIARTALDHGLGPLVYEGLQMQRSTDEIPASLLRSRERAISYELEQSIHLEELISGLGLAHIRGNLDFPCLVLKGMHLRQSIYRHAPYLRPMNDLDLLVHDVDLESARTVLAQHGYQRLTGTGPRFHQRLGHAETWVRTVRPGFLSMVDVHRRLIHRMRGAVPSALLFAQAQEFDSGMLGLSDTHLAAHLAIHLAHEFFRGRLRGLVDLDLHLLAHPEIDFSNELNDPVIRMARNALFLCHGLTSRMVPISWTPPSPAPGCGWMLRQIFQDERIFDGRKGGLQSPENLVRAMLLIESPALRMTYPGYVTATQLSGLFSRRSTLDSQGVDASLVDSG
ncbi:MAG: hypothetical protein CMH54_01570 [Myxococcales bacterium]|nr:hypothetical protein [Myxococcales bacterium]